MVEIRQEALLNEYKGNLYEFLVAHQLAKMLDLELVFLENVTYDFQKMLQQQEQFVREYYPFLLNDLPTLAYGLAKSIVDQFDVKNFKNIKLMGKAAMAAHDERFSEADILLINQEQIIPISIKLTKANSYINTKSAGLKSFFAKYFQNNSIQILFNQEVNRIIDEMIHDMYQEVGLPYDDDFKNWQASDLPTLPGQLDGHLREIYLKCLYDLTTNLHKFCGQIFAENNRKTALHLLALIGFSSPEIIQATTYYIGKPNKYQLSEHHFEKMGSDLKTFEQISLGPLKEGTANFDIYYPDRILQLRIKAMNKFTSKSFKINCSVKKHS